MHLVLVSLVRSYGVKAQKTIDEVAADTGLDSLDCEAALEILIDLRLVRHIDTYYEISHDFIARRIAFELLDSEERELKRFQELLTSKAAAYRTTESLLTSRELLMLYKHKERLIPSEMEMRFLLSSWLQGTGPALYWLLNTERAKMLEWLRAEETMENIDLDQKVSIVLLRRKLGEKPLQDEDYSAIRSYRLSAEMAALIIEDPLSLPRALTAYGLRHRRSEVREACREAVVMKIKKGDWSWVEQLRKSSSMHLRRAYEWLVLRDDISVPKESGKKNRSIQEFTLLKEIALAGSQSEAKVAFKEFQSIRPPLNSSLFGRGLMLTKMEQIGTLLRRAERISKEKADRMIAAIGASVTSAEFAEMIAAYKEWNSREKGRYETVAINAKARALALAISRAMSDEYLPCIRGAIETIRLTSSAREIIFAFLKYADSGDLQLVLNRIAAEEDRIDFWNHMELARAASRRMEEVEKQIPEFLLDIERRREFWEYIPSESRANLNNRDLLPIRDISNRALYIRLAACMMIGGAGKAEQEFLTRLSAHEYSSIAFPAAIRLVRLFGESTLRKLTKSIDRIIKEDRSSSLAGALRSAEMEYFGMPNLW